MIFTVPVMMGISMALTAASAAASIYAASEAADAETDRLQYEADAAQAAGLAEQDALAMQADIMAKKGRGDLATSINVLSGVGLDVTSGSPLMLATEQWSDINMDLNEMKRQGSIAAIQGLNQKNLLNAKASSVQAAKGLQYTGIAMNAASSMVSTGTQVAAYGGSSAGVNSGPGASDGLVYGTTNSYINP